MYISVVFPVADFRSLHREAAGRLEKPRWGESDPQAKFARGFGPIHSRTKSGERFLGENYYADCNNLLKYPSLIFVDGVIGRKRRILAYPIHRRFYFDGQMAGRFEFGFRLNEASLDDIQMISGVRGHAVEYDAIGTISQILQSVVEVEISDGREIQSEFLASSEALRDSYLLSSTKHSKLGQYDITSFGSRYVAVGAPFVFVRAGSQTPLKKAKGTRSLHSGDFKMYGARSGTQGRDIDSVIIESDQPLDGETERERFARLVYVQMRSLAFSHSFYIRQVDHGNFEGVSPLTPAISSMLDRLKTLTPVEGDGYDQEVCSAMAEVIRNSDVEPAQLAAEIERRFKKSWIARLVAPIARVLDRKTDIAIEAAASTATRHILGGGI